MNKPSLVIVLVEDACHKMLIQRYLKKHGLNEHQIRIRVSPSGSGSAENWVRKEFVKEASECRRRQARAKTALITMIDADTWPVDYRLQQLDQALREDGKQPVDPDTERIARLVPKRNVETWVLCLNGQTVSEEIDYKGKSHDWSELIPPAATTLFQWTRSSAPLPVQCIESLRCGIGELKRLKYD